MSASQTVAGDKIDMSFDENSLAHLMSVLTDLYSDKILAIIREYSTNALDAHIAAGVTLPIEVTLPGYGTPFKVRDHGIGLSRDDLQGIYSKYGASTKRGSNDQVGMLGLGCKSALSYTDQFTVTSVKDGQRTKVVVARNEAGSGSMTVVDESASNDPNGTEVTIPVAHPHGFEARAKSFFSYWKSGTVLVDGVAPARFEGDEISPGVFLVHKGYGDTPMVVMGSVAYPAPEIQTNFGHGKTVVAFVAIGDVTFPPNREALQYDEKTKARCLKIQEDAATGLRARIVLDIDAADDRHAAVQVYVNWKSLVPAAYLPSPVVYRDITVPLKLSAPVAPMIEVQDYNNSTIKVIDMANQEFWFYVPRNNYSFTDHRMSTALDIENVPTTLWVQGFDSPKWTATMRKKLDLHLTTNDQKGGYYNHIVLLKTGHTLPSLDWVSASDVISWESIKSLKLPRKQTNANGRIAGSYNLYDPSCESYLREGVPADEINQDEPIYYYVKASTGNSKAYYDALKDSEPDCTLVLFNDYRKTKFLRSFPQAQEAVAAVNTLCKDWMDNLTLEDRQSIMIQQGFYGVKRQLVALTTDTDKINDPAIRIAVKLAGRDIKDLQSETRKWGRLSIDYTVAAEWSNPLERYPLYQIPTSDTAQHVIDYLNDSYYRAELKKV